MSETGRPDPASGRSGSSVSELAEALRGIWQTLVRRRRDFITVFITISVTVVIAGFLWPGTYVARSAILITKQRLSGGLAPDAERTPTVISGGVTEEEVNSEIAVLTSRWVLDKTLKATGLDRAEPSIWIRLLFGPLWLYEDLYAWYHGVPGPTRYDRALRSIESDISVERMKDSDVLVVSYHAGHPEFARIVLEQLIGFYLEHHVYVHSNADTATFFNEQAQGLQVELRQHEEELQAIKRAVGAADLNAERHVQQKLVASLREERDRLERTVAELGERAAQYQAFLSREPTQELTSTVESRNDYALQALIQDKMKLELERVRMLERYAPDSPLLVENEKKIAATQEAIEEHQSGVFQRQLGLPPASVSASQDLERTRAERAGLVERIAKIDEQLEAERARLAELDEKLVEARRVERLIATSETQYLQYLRRGVEARIDNALDRGQFTNASIVQAAAAEPRPVKPKKLITLLLALGGGLGGALGIVLLMELRERGLESFLGAITPRPPSPTEPAHARSAETR